MFSSLQCQDRFPGPPSLLFNGYWGSFHGGGGGEAFEREADHSPVVEN